MEVPITYTEVNRRNYDPTHTTTLRNLFAQDMKVRFKKISAAIAVGVYKNDCFGLTKQPHTLQVVPPSKGAFAFPRSQMKVAKFMEWLQQQVRAGLVTVIDLEQIGASAEAAWMNKYVYDSYKRGVIRARYEMLRAQMQVPSIEDSGGIEMVMGTPFHMDRVGLLFARVYSDLKGITDAMDSQISRILAQGLIDGDGPRLLARKLVAAIDGTNAGTLGITDTLGRFIPAQRRAEILARTEIIRAHHLGTIQEYRNWGLLNIKILAEWKTAGDDRVCDKCNSLEGKIYTLDEIEPMIPLHPQCFIDPQIPIYTSDGWKPIGKVQIGDLVLTHKRRFRKVYALPRHKEKAEIITFKFPGDRGWLSMTSNHPVLVTAKNGGMPRWMPAGDVKEGFYLSLLGNRCKRCGKPIPYFRKYCSRTCLSKDITDKQWNDPKHRENVSKKNRISILKQYEEGTRDGKVITEKANEKTRLMVEDGTYGQWMTEEYFEKVRIATHTPEIREKSSIRMKKNNPMRDPIILEKAQKAMKEFYLENPERRLNALMAKHRKSLNMTGIEKKMSELLDKIGIKYIYQYPILNYNVDFAIPGLKIVIECDGEYWHQDKEKDAIRDGRIEKEGWIVLHYSGTKINQCLSEIEQELSRVLCNHLGEFDLVAWPVKSVKKWTLSRAMPLYNLSVEEDESYVAKGVVVHNCRCIALPWIEELLKYE